MRILPEIWPSTTWPFSNLTRKVALGRFSRTSPCICMTSSFAIVFFLPHWQARALEVRLLEQRVVLVRHHVSLRLSHEIHSHHYNNQQRGATKVERYIPAHLHELGQQAHQRDVDGPGQSQAHEYLVDVARR